MITAVEVVGAVTAWIHLALLSKPLVLVTVRQEIAKRHSMHTKIGAGLIESENEVPSIV